MYRVETSCILKMPVFTPASNLSVIFLKPTEMVIIYYILSDGEHSGRLSNESFFRLELFKISFIH